MTPLPRTLFGDASLFAPRSPHRRPALRIAGVVLVIAAVLSVAAVVALPGGERSDTVAEPSAPCRILIRADLSYPADACRVCECVEITAGE